MSNKLRLQYSYASFVILYAVGTLFLPTKNTKIDLTKYHISLLHLRLLDLSIVIPYAIIWLCAMYGFYRLVEYSALIKDHRDSRSVEKITIGIGYLAFWLPVTSVFSTYSNYLAYKNPGIMQTMAVLQNYLTLLIPLIGFMFISSGTRGLLKITRQSIPLVANNIIAVIIIGLGVFYTHLIATTHNRLNSIYHISIVYILLSITIPYIYMWYIGTISFWELYTYRRKVSGIIYRKMWNLLALGIGWIIFISIALQYITTLSNRLNRLSLNIILLIIYLLLALLAFGFVLIALGVKKLKKIEEV